MKVSRDILDVPLVRVKQLSFATVLSRWTDAMA